MAAADGAPPRTPDDTPPGRADDGNASDRPTHDEGARSRDGALSPSSRPEAAEPSGPTPPGAAAAPTGAYVFRDEDPLLGTAWRRAQGEVTDHYRFRFEVEEMAERRVAEAFAAYLDDPNPVHRLPERVLPDEEPTEGLGTPRTPSALPRVERTSEGGPFALADPTGARFRLVQSETRDAFLVLGNDRELPPAVRAEAEGRRQEVKSWFDARWEPDAEAYQRGDISLAEFRSRFDELSAGLRDDFEIKSAAHLARESARETFEEFETRLRDEGMSAPPAGSGPRGI